MAEAAGGTSAVSLRARPSVKRKMQVLSRDTISKAAEYHLLCEGYYDTITHKI